MSFGEGLVLWHAVGVDAGRAETYMRLLIDVELRHTGGVTAERVAGSAVPAGSRAAGSLGRVMAAAGALVAAGMLDEDLAWTVVAELREALVLRDRIGYLAPDFRMLRRVAAARPLDELRAGAAGLVRAVPAGQVVSLDDHGRPVRVSLLALVVAPGWAVLTMAARWPPEPGSGPEGGRPAGVRHPFRFRVTDDRGAAYRAGVSGRSGPGLWEGLLRLYPVPPAGTRWLELSPVAGGDSVRVEIAAPGGQDHPVREDRNSASPGGRVLDTAAWALLAAAPDSFRELAAGMRHVGSAVAALVEVGALSPADPAAARLVELCRQLGIETGATEGEVHAQRAVADDQPASAGLPSDWASVLAHRGVRDGRAGTAPLAVVLPELGGVRLALAGLQSSPGGFTLRVLIVDGQLPQPRMTLGMRHAEPFTWWAVDNAGRSHAGSAEGWDDDNEPGHLRVRFRTPLSPSATSLGILVTGDTGSIRVTVPHQICYPHLP